MRNDKEDELRSILKFGISIETIDQFDIILLPENIKDASHLDELYDASDVIVLSKLLKSAGIKCANSYDLGLESQIFERRSSEKWFGIIYIRNNVAIPILVGVLSTLLANEIWESLQDDERPIPKVHVELKIEKGNNVTTLKYDGDAQTLITIVNGLNNGNGSDSEYKISK